MACRTALLSDGARCRILRAMTASGPGAVLIIGAYGTGKSSVAAEIATLLEDPGVRFAAIDLDWLAWANLPDGHGSAGHRLMLANLADMARNFRDVGMTHFVLAGSFGSPEQIEGIRAMLGIPLRVVRLTAPLEEIERRLDADPTSGRQDDLQEARQQMAAGEGVGLEDMAVSNADRPIREVATEIIAWLGWA